MRGYHYNSYKLLKSNKGILQTTQKESTGFDNKEIILTSVRTVLVEQTRMGDGPAWTEEGMKGDCVEAENADNSFNKIVGKDKKW